MQTCKEAGLAIFLGSRRSNYQRCILQTVPEPDFLSHGGAPRETFRQEKDSGF